MSKKIKELKLTSVSEVSLCTKFNGPANRLKGFEIIKSDIKKDMYEDLFEEMESPEFGEFVSYLELWLEDDVNRVAYSAFIDALFASLQDVVYMSELSKEDKANKFKDIFDKFIEEYKNSAITKSEDGKVVLNIEVNKQEKRMSILEKLENFVSELKKTKETVEVIETPVEKVEEVEEAESQTEEIEGQEIVVDEVPAEEPIAEIEAPELESEEPTLEEPVEIQEIIAEEVAVAEEPVQEPELVVEEVVEETVEEVEKSSIKIDEILKANEELTLKLEKIEKANLEQAIKLEKAELMEDVTKSFYGLPKTKEEVVEVIYELNKANISDESKTFIKESLKSLSSLNKASFEELGHSEEVDVNKSESETIIEKAKKLVTEESIDENQAILVVKGRRTLEQAKKVSEKLKK